MPPKGWKKKARDYDNAVGLKVDPPKRLYILNFKARARVERYVLASSHAEAEKMAMDEMVNGSGFVATVKPGYANTVQVQELTQITVVDHDTVQRLKKASSDKQMLMSTGHSNMANACKHLLRKL